MPTALRGWIWLDALIKDLKSEKITYWVDIEQIKPSDSIIQKIEEGLKRADI